MKRVGIRELHAKTGALVDLAAEGHSVLVQRRGKVVAELRAAGPSASGRTLPDRKAVLARFPDVPGDSGRYLEEERS